MKILQLLGLLASCVCVAACGGGGSGSSGSGSGSGGGGGGGSTSPVHGNAADGVLFFLDDVAGMPADAQVEYESAFGTRIVATDPADGSVLLADLDPASSGVTVTVVSFNGQPIDFAEINGFGDALLWTSTPHGQFRLSLSNSLSNSSPTMLAVEPIQSVSQVIQVLDSAGDPIVGTRWGFRFEGDQFFNLTDLTDANGEVGFVGPFGRLQEVNLGAVGDWMIDTNPLPGGWQILTVGGFRALRYNALPLGPIRYEIRQQ